MKISQIPIDVNNQNWRRQRQQPQRKRRFDVRTKKSCQKKSTKKRKRKKRTERENKRETTLLSDKQLQVKGGQERRRMGKKGE